MSLFQCGVCGCLENTALSGQGCSGYTEKFYDWTGIVERRGKLLCSEHAPARYRDGAPTKFGKWHGVFVDVISLLAPCKLVAVVTYNT